jgi:peptidoglycan/xylan/chitin deacetylase (PgdA/CDA1 family)
MGKLAPQRTEAADGANEVDTAELTVERAAWVIRSIPEYVPRRSAARIVTSSLSVANIEVEDLSDSCEARDRELQQRIDQSRQTIEELEQGTQEVIRSLEEQIARASEARDVWVQSEQESMEQAQAEVADLQRLRAFLFSPEHEEVHWEPQQEERQEEETPKTVVRPLESAPVDDEEPVEVEDGQGEPDTRDSQFEAAVRILRSRHVVHTTILVSTLLSAGALSYVAVVPQMSLGPESPQTSTGSNPGDPSASSAAGSPPDEASMQPANETIKSIFARHPSPSLAAPGEALDYGGRIALTFDDGPDPKVTPTVLDTLRENNLKATFFVSGDRATQHPELIRRIVREGHTLGNHTHSHPNMALLPPGDIHKELRRTQQAVNRALGYRYEMVMMRPPYGEPYFSYQNVLPRFRAIIRRQTLAPILWDIDSKDWALAGQPGSIVRTVLRSTGESGGVVLMHDTHESTAKALPQIINRYEKRGLSFTSVTEMLAKKYRVDPG